MMYVIYYEPNNLNFINFIYIGTGINISIIWTKIEFFNTKCYVFLSV